MISIPNRPDALQNVLVTIFRVAQPSSHSYRLLIRKYTQDNKPSVRSLGLNSPDKNVLFREGVGIH